jgi:hypothetical protein
MAIPKIIHYVWVGGKPLPSLAERCIESWRKFCPDYEIKRWDETNFDISSNQYCKEAYDMKKFAFVSDYIRLYALVNYGGVYMDTDVELLKPIDSYLAHQSFSGFEDEKRIPTGIMACEKDFPLFCELLSEYCDRKFLLPDGSMNVITNCRYITDLCLKKGLVLINKLQAIDGFTLYPNDVFCPRSFSTGKYNVTENTVAIHHFNGSWLDESRKTLNQERWNFYEKYGNDEYVVDMYQKLKDCEKKTIDSVPIKLLYKVTIKRTIKGMKKRFLKPIDCFMKKKMKG